MKRSGSLRKVFYGAALTFVGLHWGSYALIAEHSDAELTDEIAASIGMSKNDLKNFAKSKFLIVAPAHENTRRFFKLTFHQAPDDSFVTGSSLNAQARQNAFYGYNSFADKITGGISGALHPCLVLLDPQRVTKETVARLVSFAYPEKIKNMPGTDADYLKIVTLHELEHCRHVTSHREPVLQEYHADRRALQKFIDDGGDRNVVKAWIAMRSMTMLRNAVLYVTEPGGDPYAMAPALYKELVLGQNQNTPARLEDLQAVQMGYAEAAHHLLAQAAQQKKATPNLNDPAIVYRMTKQILRDPATQMSEDARAILQLNIESYQFLTRPPAHRPATEPAPKVS